MRKKADIAKLREICEQLSAAEAQPDYEATYRKLAAEAEAVFANDPNRSDFLEVLIPYSPEFVSWRLEQAREQREQDVPAA